METAKSGKGVEWGISASAPQKRAFIARYASRGLKMQYGEGGLEGFSYHEPVRCSWVIAESMSMQLSRGSLAGNPMPQSTA